MPDSYIVIKYERPSPSGKTRIFRVDSKRGDNLGEIRWYGPWRQYVFMPESGTIWSAGCLADVITALNNTKASPAERWEGAVPK